MLSRIGCVRFAGVLLTLFAGAGRAQDTVWVSVRGTAWDSLRNAPLGGAFIAIAGSSRTAVSDARGRFRIDSVMAGPHTFTMQHDMLDSIGFSGRSTRAVLDATHYAVTIAVPSFATLWRGLCGGTPPRDSGIVYGVVRDLADKPLPGASVGVVWKDVSYQRKTGIDWRDMGGQTVADSTGRFALCGVPIAVGLHLAASADLLVSAVVDLAPLTLRVARRDFRLAKDSLAGGVAEFGYEEHREEFLRPRPQCEGTHIGAGGFNERVERLWAGVSCLVTKSPEARLCRNRMQRQPVYVCHISQSTTELAGS